MSFSFPVLLITHTILLLRILIWIILLPRLLTSIPYSAIILFPVIYKHNKVHALI